MLTKLSYYNFFDVNSNDFIISSKFFHINVFKSFLLEMS